jgi:hypothetical protein
MEEQAQILIKNLNAEAKNNKSFELLKFIKNCALDIICGKHTFFGISKVKKKKFVSQVRKQSLNWNKPGFKVGQKTQKLDWEMFFLC